MDIYVYASYHIIHVIIYASMISYFMLIHIGSPEGVTLLELEESYKSTLPTNVKLIIHLADNHAHAYTIYHIISSLMHSWYSFVHMHAIGSPKGVTLLEFEPEHQEEQQASQEQEVQAEGVNVEDLLECPDDKPSSFLKGKP